MLGADGQTPQYSQVYGHAEGEGLVTYCLSLAPLASHSLSLPRCRTMTSPRAPAPSPINTPPIASLQPLFSFEGSGCRVEGAGLGSVSTITHGWDVTMAFRDTGFLRVAIRDTRPVIDRYVVLATARKDLETVFAGSQLRFMQHAY